MSCKITIVFDNQSLLPGFKTEWGFACVIETKDEKILFDTGNDGKMLLENMAGLQFFPQDFTRLIISHMHWDHVGGIPEFLHSCPHCITFLPASSLDDDVKIIRSLCSAVTLVGEPKEITKNVFSTGELPGYAWEQAIVVNGSSGLIIITGCAHPGIVTIMKKARELFPGVPVKLLLGGFHLNQTPSSQVNTICRELLTAGIEKIAPAHCTGVQAISLCQNIFREKFLPTGVGFRFELS